MPDIQIDRATEADIPALVAAEAACFSDPWGAGGIGSQIAGAGLSLVARCEGNTVGYLFLSFCPPEGDVLRLATLPHARRRGVGLALMKAGMQAAGGRGVHTLFLEVRAGGEAARALYTRCGFSVCGRRRDFYRAPREDAVLMKWEAETDAVSGN